MEYNEKLFKSIRNKQNRIINHNKYVLYGLPIYI